MKQRVQGIVIGMVIMSLIYAMPVLAAFIDKYITVQTGVNIYVNDNLLKPTDANGNPVEPFIYEGTTYLPVRAIANAFDTDVKWEGKTGSVYVGKHKSDEPAVLLQDLDYFTGKDFKFKTSEKDNLGKNQTNVLYGYSIENVYKINGKYTSIAGTLFQFYESRSSSWPSNIKIYGDGKLLYEADMNKGIEPIDFNIDITGVLELKVDFYGGESAYGCFAAISNFGLYH